MTRVPSRKLTLLLGAIACCLGACTSFKLWSYEGGDRDAWQRPTAIVAALQLHQGDTVADIGAGGGYFTVRLAAEVGPQGKVYAVDVDEAMLAVVRERAAAKALANVETILAQEDDPLLPPGDVDMIFMSNTYHHLGDRTEYFLRVKRYLRPGGRIAILELNDSSWFTALFGHYTPPDVIRREMEAAGYMREIKLEFVKEQSFQIFIVRP